MVSLGGPVRKTAKVSAVFQVVCLQCRVAFKGCRKRPGNAHSSDVSHFVRVNRWGLPQRLLIADDNATGRRLLRALLETQEGWEVCGEAENGIEAIVRAAELKPDLIILDLAMPLMDGLHAAQEISAASPNLPIVLYTMHHFAGLDLEAKKVGIRKVISKTASGDALMLAIEEALNARAQEAAGSLGAMSQPGIASSTGVADARAPGDIDPSSKAN